MFRVLLLAFCLALLTGCVSEPEPMRTGVAASPRYHPPDPSRPLANPSNPAIIGESAWQSEGAKWIGAPFRAGGNTREGMDSLGLVRRMYQNVARIRLSGDLEELSRTGVAIPREQIRPGDILFFGAPRIDAAAIYIGENRFVQAIPNFGVAYGRLTDPQFSQNYRTARRILR